ncbi:MAG: YdcH family protein [Pseudomonadota bacterium]
MNVSPHLETLRTRHAALETEIRDEERRPSADSLELASLKRRKLQLKEEIERLSAQH